MELAGKAGEYFFYAIVFVAYFFQAWWNKRKIKRVENANKATQERVATETITPEKVNELIAGAKQATRDELNQKFGEQRTIWQEQAESLGGQIAELKDLRKKDGEVIGTLQKEVAGYKDEISELRGKVIQLTDDLETETKTRENAEKARYDAEKENAILKTEVAGLRTSIDHLLKVFERPQNINVYLAPPLPPEPEPPLPPPPPGNIVPIEAGAKIGEEKIA